MKATQLISSRGGFLCVFERSIFRWRALFHKVKNAKVKWKACTLNDPEEFPKSFSHCSGAAIKGEVRFATRTAQID